MLYKKLIGLTESILDGVTYMKITRELNIIFESSILKNLLGFN